MNSKSCCAPSSVGLKIIMAVTGLMIVGFIVAHLAGNLLIFAGPEALNAYAKGLRNYLPVLWVLRIGLIVASFLHIWSAIRLTRINRQAKPQSYAVKRSVKATLPSRTMGLSGLVVLCFAVYHLLHLTFRATHAELQGFGEYDVYSMMLFSFQSPLLTLFYSVGVLLLGMHLNHGINSLFQTLGYPMQHRCRLLGPVLGSALALGFLSIPLAIYTGIVA